MKLSAPIKITFTTALIVVAGHFAIAFAAPLNLSSTPLFLGGGADPNVVFTLDDSGSMQFEVMPEENFISEIQFLFPRPNAPYGGATYPNYVPNFNDKNLHNFLARSAHNNAIFYNPNIDYKPWANSDGSLMPNANPIAALYNPKIPPQGLNLKAQQIQSAIWFGYCGLPNGSNQCANTGAYTTAEKDIAYCQAGTSNSYDNCPSDPTQWTLRNHTYWPITYYNYSSGPVTQSSSYTKVQITSSTASNATFAYTDSQGVARTRTRDQEIQNFANWFQYYRSRILAARAGIGRAFSQQRTGMRVGFAAINTDGAIIRGVRPFTPGSADRNQFFDLLYNHVIPTDATPLRRAMDDVGKYFQRGGSDGPWDNTPENSGDATTELECRQSYQVLMTDGYWNGAAAQAATGNVDGVPGTVISNPKGGSYSYQPIAPYRDNRSDTLADAGMYYWNHDLRTNLDNKVPTSTTDPAFWQHLVNFTIGLGVSGTLNPNTALAGLTSGSLLWPQPCESTILGGCRGENIDDLWHTAVNSRGGFFSATNPDAFASALGSALRTIKQRVSSSAAIAVNSGSITSDARLYQARFNSGDWSGQLLAHALHDGVNHTYGCTDSDPIGKVCPTSVWDAGDVIDTQDWDTGRKIVTVKPSTGAKIPFRWTGLDTSQQSALNIDPTTAATDTRGQERLDFLRGNTEITDFRVRSSALGDIVHSAPVYAGAPSFSYPNDWDDALTTANDVTAEDAALYSTFRASNKNRAPMVYVGANDGMLHGFDATNGQERFAYVPSPVFKNLNKLTAPNYSHQSSYVDGSPTAVDAFTSGAWRTLVAGGLRGGGQAVYALDVTTPPTASDTEATIANRVLWEFTDAQDVDLGYTYGEVNIVRMHNGKWAAIFGNGYNSTEADGRPGSGNAVLYILYIEDGVNGWQASEFRKIDTLAGPAADPLGQSRPNGLATPAPVDVDGDYIVDYIYAGDLFGNMWKFDVTNGSAASWKIAYGTTSAPQPLFKARATAADTSAQPITTRPQIGLHPNGYPNTAGVMVYFGTGQYIVVGDNTQSSQITQTFYGIWDKNPVTFTAFNRSHLLQQQITKEVTVNGYKYRVTSDNPINWHTGSGLPSGSPAKHLGWYLDLYNTQSNNTINYGERQVTNPVLRNNRIIFTTLIPASPANACEPDGTGWLMELDAASGRRLSFPAFDINNDRKFDTQNDYIDTDGDNSSDTPPSGVQSTVGNISTPAIVQATSGNPEFKYTSGSTKEIEMTRENPGTGEIGRQSWRQLR